MSEIIRLPCDVHSAEVPLPPPPHPPHFSAPLSELSARIRAGPHLHIYRKPSKHLLEILPPKNEEKAARRRTAGEEVPWPLHAGQT